MDLVAPGMGLLAKVMLLGKGLICAMVVATHARARRRLVVSMSRWSVRNVAEEKVNIQR